MYNSSFYFTLDFFQIIFKLWISSRVSLNSSCAQWLAQSFTRRSHLRSLTLKSITSSTCPPFWRWPGEEILLRGWHHVSTGWGNRNMPLKHGLPTPYLFLPTIEWVLHYELNTPEVWNHYNSNKKYFFEVYWVLLQVLKSDNSKDIQLLSVKLLATAPPISIPSSLTW